MKLDSLLTLGVGIAIGIAGTMAFHVNQPGPDAGDWLAFSGALVGVSLTIVGTLWLENHRALKVEKENASIYRQALDEIVAALDAAARERGDDVIATFRESQIELERKLIRSFEKFVFAKHYAPKKNVAALQAMEEFADQVEREKAMIENEVRIIQDAGDNNAVLGVNLSKMGQARDRLSAFLVSAISTLDTNH